MITVLIAVWIVQAYAAGHIAYNKRRSVVFWAFMGFMLGPFGVLASLLNSSADDKPVRNDLNFLLSGGAILISGIWLFFATAPQMDIIRQNLAAGGQNGGTSAIQGGYYFGIVAMIIGALLILPGLMALAMKSSQQGSSQS